MTLDLAFHGAAGCVTGFCALVSTDTSRVLIDCGMFQGPKSLKALNYEPFPFDASKIDAVLLPTRISITPDFCRSSCGRALPARSTPPPARAIFAPSCWLTPAISRKRRSPI